MKKILLFGSLLTFLSLTVQSQDLTFEAGLQLLYKNNLQLKTLESKLLQAKYKKLETFSNWLPKIQLQTQYTKLSQPQMDISKLPAQQRILFEQTFPATLISDQLYSTGFSVSQLIFSSGKILSAYKISCLNYELIKNEYEKTKQELEIQYKETFLKTLLAKKILEVTQKAVEISSQNYKVSLELYKEARVSYLDLSSSKINYYNSEINLLKIKNGYEISKKTLKNLLCIDYEVEPVGELENFLEEPKYELTQLKNNIQKVYEVKSVELQRKILMNNLNITKTEILPTVVLAGNYSWTVDDYTKPLDDWDHRYNWSVVLSWPIFSGGATYSKYKQNKENIYQIDITRESLVSTLQLQLDSLYSTYVQLKESLSLAKQNLIIAEENYNVAKSYYLEGRSSYLELLQAELGLSNSKVNYYQTLTEYIIVCEKLKKFEK